MAKGSHLHLSVRNVLGCEMADISLAPVALIAGINHQGKTSVCRALQATLTGQAVPLLLPGSDPTKVRPAMPKKDGAALVRTGTAKGTATLASPDGANQVNVTWPACDVATMGVPVSCSLIAAGMLNLADMEAKARAAYLGQLLNTNPTLPDLRLALHDVGVEDFADRLWLKLEEQADWDLVWTAAKEQGAKLKGAWEAATGQKYGKDKAETYAQQAAPVSHETLAKRVEEAQHILERAIADEAIASHETQQLRVVAAGLDEMTTALANSDITHETAAKEVQAAMLLRAQLPSPSGNAIPCPHCGQPLSVKVNKLGVNNAPFEWTILKGEASLSKEEQRARSATIDITDRTVLVAREKLRAAEQDWDICKARHDTAKQAKLKLETLQLPERDGDPVDADVATLREALQLAVTALANIETQEKAAKAHKGVVTNQKIVDVLAPDGVRRTVLLRAIGQFNTALSISSIQAKWQTVAIDPDSLMPIMGGRNYLLLSASEKFRVNVILQLIIAELDSSPAVVIDGADILDKDGRNGLFALLRDTPSRCALVTMTMSAPDLVPDLFKAKLGASYWVSGGRVQPLQGAA